MDTRTGLDTHTHTRAHARTHTHTHIHGPHKFRATKLSVSYVKLSAMANFTNLGNVGRPEAWQQDIHLLSNWHRDSRSRWEKWHQYDWYSASWCTFIHKHLRTYHLSQNYPIHQLLGYHSCKNVTSEQTQTCPQDPTRKKYCLHNTFPPPPPSLLHFMISGWYQGFDHNCIT